MVTCCGDSRPLNIGLASAWRKAANRDAWRSVVDTTYAQDEFAMKEEDGLYIARFVSSALEYMNIYGGV